MAQMRIGFHEHFTGSTAKKIEKHEIAIVEEYQQFIIEALEKGIKNLSLKGIEKYKHEFICDTLAASFFRVPLFQQIVLGKIVEAGQEKMESQDIEPDEWIEQQRIFVAKAEIDVAALGRSSTDFG